MRGPSLSTRKIAFNGILGALAVICLWMAGILPTNKLSLLALSSFFIAVVIIESGVKAGWLFFTATSLLSLLLVPDKTIVIPYVVFFGIYGILKYYIEKLDKLVPEYVLKFVYYNACMGLAALAVNEIFGYGIVAELPWWLLIVVLEIVFLIYDTVYTLFIRYYRNQLKPRLKL